MKKAIWNRTVIAESKEPVRMEGDYYFPQEDIKMDLLVESEEQKSSPWKGEAAYYHIQTNGDVNHNAAWSYPNPKPAAEKIKGCIAFGKGVEVIDS